jgi:hypothetical protein
MGRRTLIALTSLILLVPAFMGCDMSLLDVVKEEIQIYERAQAGNPQISVMKGITPVSDGGDVYVGSAVAVTGNKPVTFTIENLGNGELELLGTPRVVVDTAVPVEFEIISLPSARIAPGTKSDFVIDFKPQTISQRTATINIENSASDDGTFTFTMTGDGTAGPAADIQIQQGPTVVDEVYASYSYDFGLTHVSQTKSAVFTISNMGTPGWDLALNGSPAVDIIGTDAAMFSVDQPADLSIAFDETVDFTVYYDPTTEGTHQATIQIQSNDPNGSENPYEISIIGSGADLDVFFLVDKSGSMGDDLAHINASINSAMTGIAALEPGFRAAVGWLSDFPIPNFGFPGDEPFFLVQELTQSTAAVMSGLNSLFATGGGDAPGSHLEAMYQAATSEGLDYGAGVIPPMPAGWDPDSEKVLFIFTDLWFHDPDLEPTYPGHNFSETIAALQAAGIKVVGMDLYRFSLPQLAADLNAVTGPTGGLYFKNYYNLAADIVDAIDQLTN